jgi:hypothetical protein
MKTFTRPALRTFCGFTIAASTWLFVMYFVLGHPGYLWRAAIAAGFVAVGLTTWIAAGRTTPAGWLRTLTAAGGVAIFAAGAWAMHTNVDEGFVDVVSLALMTQAVLTWLWAAGTLRPRPSHTNAMRVA